MTAEENIITWFEIPVIDIQRAKKFYETLFDLKMREQELMDMDIAYFPFEVGNGKVSGSLVKGNMHLPSKGGNTIVYFNANPFIQTIIDKVEPAGGKVILTRTLITEEVGYMAIFTDTEGNSIGLHAIE